MSTERQPRIQELTHHGITMSVKAWAELIGVDPCVIYTRMKRGDSPARCVRPRDYERGPIKKPRKGLWDFIREIEKRKRPSP